MKDPEISIHINQLAGAVVREINTEQDVDRNCRLQDVSEMLRRAFHILNQTPYEPNDLLGELYKGTPDENQY